MKTTQAPLTFFTVLSSCTVSLLITLLTACAHQNKESAPNYYDSYAQWSREEKSYEGLHQSMQSLVVVFSPDMIRAITREKGKMYGWSTQQIEQQLSQELAQAEKVTKGFIGFYFSQRRVASLTRRNTAWNVFLDVDGKRFTGRMKRDRTALPELRRLYPDLTLWQTPYHLEFDVPWSSLQGKTFTIHISGPLGHQSFQF